MTQSRQNIQTTFTHSKTIEGQKKSNREKTRIRNIALWRRYRTLKREYQAQGKPTKYWDSRIAELEKALNKNSTF